MTDQTQLLLVDDDPNITLTLSTVLERDSCIVKTASTLEALGNLLSRLEFHVAVVDLRIGSDSGIEAIRIIRKFQPDCAPILITGYGSMESCIMALRVGAFDYILKPVNLSHLRQSISGARNRFDRYNACRRCLKK
jgi:DNA-binding NtrC family response regulator